MDSREQISALIDAIVDEKSVDAESAFDQIMADRLADRIGEYRQDMANKFFNPEAAEQASGEELEQSEEESEEDATE
jgi:hypothetical protein